MLWWVKLRTISANMGTQSALSFLSVWCRFLSYHRGHRDIPIQKKNSKKNSLLWNFISNCVLFEHLFHIAFYPHFLKLGTQFVMYYKLRCNSTRFEMYYKLRNYYKLQRNTACISLALPLSVSPFTRDTHMVCLQWNISQCVQICIFNISNPNSFKQTIYLWYKQYSKWICVTFSFQYRTHCHIFLEKIIV